MTFGVANKSIILNRFGLQNLQRNITHLAVITRKTNKKDGILKGGDWKKALNCFNSRLVKLRPSLVKKRPSLVKFLH